MSKALINLVWLKRDLRLTDHLPLKRAIDEQIPTIVFYCFEPHLMKAEEYSDRHWRFIYQSLQDLNQQLEKFSISIQVFHNEVIKVLELISNHFQIGRLFSHQETGIKLTFDRDISVKDYCKKWGIRWEEYTQDGVIRGAKNRKGWEIQLKEFFQKKVNPINFRKIIPVEIPIDFLKKIKGQPLPKAIKSFEPAFQIGGPTYAWLYLNSFKRQRVLKYGFQLSKPALSRMSCSRLSPYLAYGNVSCREIWQITDRAKSRETEWGLDNFQTRLWWRSHYLQKLESMWQLEFEPINSGMKQLDRSQDETLFNAWATGNTGFPMVDASMRCLIHNGWINFRMRAMLVTFATFALWLDWRLVAIHLARLFLDFEPGIHYPQIQMQAGLTGYHTLRIFNPTVQCKEHDVEGIFLKNWLPELGNLPAPQIHEPWKVSPMEESFFNFKAGINYPNPIIDYDKATKINKDKYWEVRQSKQVIQELPAIWNSMCLPKNIEEYKKLFEFNTSSLL